ncbi:MULTISPECIES: hypothetical protein [unclassified Nitrosomonas]|jgi:hypothetical protein|uniref:hypothetical protein n=1 Tax=unclassified Nitrosomonas TaxID=2609265 RepID=UPI000890FCFA|nr:MULTISPECIES: hypothetical protein [unclassified Nitrosomonas]SDH25657.1 hypothetical protein SAMN05428952_100919 [Nitrosomonas sp. Nm132]SDY37906.1 hypothetical protein SAMN05421754_100823 [Nitrosomonas sp. Nm58]
MTNFASVASESAPLQGQDHRSSYNFQLLPNNDPQSGFTISSAQGVVFDIKQDVTGSDPTPVKSVTNGSTIQAGVLKNGNNYYIANPQHANGNFVVTLNQ